MSDLEKALKTLSKTQASMMNSHNQAINRLEVQISQLANSLNERQKGTLSSPPLPNPRNSFPIHEAEDITLRQCNTVHILRSGKQVDNQVSNAPVSNLSVSNPPMFVQPKPVSNDPSSSSSSQPSTLKSKEKEKSAEQTYNPIVPFPNRLTNTKTNAQMEKIRKMFNQVQINVPLLDAIQQVPSYAKFLKDMCTKTCSQKGLPCLKHQRVAIRFHPCKVQR